jgi:hypothetical protein
VRDQLVEFDDFIQRAREELHCVAALVDLSTDTVVLVFKESAAAKGLQKILRSFGRAG